MPDLVRLSPGFTEVGRPGTQIFSGSIVDEEYLSALTGVAKYRVYDEMKRSDPIISGILSAIKLPILAAEWDIESPGNTDKDKERTDFFRKMLIDSGLFQRSLPEQLEYLDNGFAPFETVYALRGQILFLEKVSHRAPKTINAWFADEMVRQIVEVEQDPGFGTNSKIRIPARRMIVLTHSGIGLNMEGYSVLRPMYKPWYFKYGAERLAAVGIERSEVPVPWGTYPQLAESDGTKDKLEEVLKWFVGHEQAYLMTPENVKIELLESKYRNLSSLLEYFRYQDQAIATAALAQFAAAVGAATSGISETEPLMDLFLAAQQARVRLIEDAFNVSDPRLKGQVAPMELMTRYNFGPRVPVPKLRCSKIQHLTFNKFSKMIKDLMIANGIEVDDPLLDRIRKVTGLPLRDPATTREQVSTGTNMQQNTQKGASNIENNK